MLLYKPLLSSVEGNIYQSIKSMYSHTALSIRINGKLWFDWKPGVALWKNLSPTSFALFINDFVQELTSGNNFEFGITIRNRTACMSVLMYADDVLLVAYSKNKLQIVLDASHMQNKMLQSPSVCTFIFHIGDNILEPRNNNYNSHGI